MKRHRPVCSRVTLTRHASALPQFVHGLLASPPRRGEGLNNWFFRVSRVLHPFRDPIEIIELLRRSTASFVTKDSAKVKKSRRHCRTLRGNRANTLDEESCVALKAQTGKKAWASRARAWAGVETGGPLLTFRPKCYDCRDDVGLRLGIGFAGLAGTVHFFGFCLYPQAVFCKIWSVLRRSRLSVPQRRTYLLTL